VNKNRYPEGWDEEHVRRVLEHYTGQSDAEAVAEDEAAFEIPDMLACLRYASDVLTSEKVYLIHP
jgi:hypothetical protein